MDREDFNLGVHSAFSLESNCLTSIEDVIRRTYTMLRMRWYRCLFARDTENRNRREKLLTGDESRSFGLSNEHEQNIERLPVAKLQKSENRQAFDCASAIINFAELCHAYAHESAATMCIPCTFATFP